MFVVANPARAFRGTPVVLAILAALMMSLPAGAQTYGAGVSANGQGVGCSNGSGVASNSTGVDSAALYGANGSGTTQQQNCGTGYNAGGGPFQTGIASPGFTPTVIPSVANQQYGDSNVQTEDLRTAPSAADGAFPAPLYARQGAVPGEFKLFRRPPPPLSEFEKFVKVTLDRSLPRFGSSLILNGTRGFATPSTTTVPPNYALNPGDELLIGVTGSVEANLRLVIDNEGRIFVPKLGAVNVAGLHYGDLQAALARRFNEQYKQVKISVVVSRLHGVTVYVTGFAVSPGAYVVGSLSTLIDAVLQAGGPSEGGSFRTIELRRAGRLVTTLDLYDLLLRGDTSHDAVLQNGDVLTIDPVGPEVAVTGSVNAEAIYEAKTGETLGDLIRYAGGPTSLADDSRVFIARLENANKTGWEELPIAEVASYPADAGDIVRLVSRAPIAEPRERQAVLVSIEGEVERPGRYYLRPGTTVGEVLARAGGLTSGAYVFGTEIDRESVKKQQEIGFEKAIDDLEVAAAAAPLAALSSGGDRLSQDQSRQQAAFSAIERLRNRKPDGRVVLDLSPTAVDLPGRLVLENNDRIYVPARPSTLGVFGAVYRPSSFLYKGGRLGDYLVLAGGAQKYADRSDVFVVRANGAVLSARHDHDFLRAAALPGDVIFMPVRTSPGALQRLVDIATIVFNFGIGAATIRGLVG